MLKEEFEWRCIGVVRCAVGFGGSLNCQTQIVLEEKRGQRARRVTQTFAGWHDYEVGDLFRRLGDGFEQVRSVPTVINSA